MALGMLLVLLIGTALYQAYSSVIASRRGVYHTQEAINAITELRAAVKSAETGQRGYIITGKRSYLEPYETEVNRMPERINLVRQITAENPIQQKLLADLEKSIYPKLAELKETVDLRQKNGFSAAAQVVQTDRGKNLMDDIKATIRVMISNEMTLLQTRNALLDRNTENCFRIFLLLGICAIGLFCAFGYFMRRYVSELMTAHEALTDHKNRLEEFYAVLAHELRTPITSIKGSLSLMSGGLAGELTEEAGELVSLAQGETERMLRLINELLDLKKIEEGKFDLNLSLTQPDQLVSKTVNGIQGMAREAGIKIVEQVKTNPPIRCDEDRIVQVLTNFISNALKFSPRDTVVEVSVDASSDQIKFSIRDQGPGIPVNQQDKLFKKFQQLDGSHSTHKGTGLGLAISKSIAEIHGGSVGFITEVGQGSTFWLSLPLPMLEQGNAV